MGLQGTSPPLRRQGAHCLPLGSLPQLLPLPSSGVWDGWSASPGPPKSDGRTKVAGIMGLLRPLQGLQPGSRNFLGTASCGASPWTLPAVEEAA